MVNIVIDDKIPYIQGILEQYAHVSYLPAKEITKEKLVNTDALVIRTRTRCNADLLDGTAVKFIASATIGYDHIDTRYCSENGIRWTNAAGCNSSSVQQYVLAAILELACKQNFQLQGKTIGIVGVGNVGAKVAEMAEILGMRTLLCDPPRARKEGAAAFVALDELVSAADIVSIHVSLSHDGDDKTDRLFNRDIIYKLKPKAILINTSRGEVIDEQLLKVAIQKKQLSDVVLDVWRNEPFIDYELLDLVTIGTPHIAGYSVDGKAMGTAMSVNALSRFFGWKLDTWFPQPLPQPEHTELRAEFSLKPLEQNIYHLVKQTYNIVEDDKRLRLSPKDFEHQRSFYPLRREFDTYTVAAIGITENDRQKLSRLGFRIT